MILKSYSARQDQTTGQPCSRTANTFPSLNEVEEIIRRLESIPLPSGKDWEHHFIRPRAVYFDNKHEQFTVYADYLFPNKQESLVVKPREINSILKDGMGLYSKEGAMWYITYWDIRYVPVSEISDHFHLDHKNYYEPFMDKFKIGFTRSSFIGEMV